MELFHVTNGQSVSIDSMNIADKQTTPPKPFTEGTLIDAMKNLKKYIDSDSLKNAVSDRGLGTVATRAGIIEKLLQMKVVEKVKKGKVPYLHATTLGHPITSRQHFISGNDCRMGSKIIRDRIWKDQTRSVYEEHSVICSEMCK